MIVDQGVTCRAINLDDGQVLVEGPDGKFQTCRIIRWFGVNGLEVSGPQLALTFAFEAFGFDRNGLEVSQRYDALLEGLGEPITRNPDGSFGEGRRAAERLSRQIQANAAREAIPGVDADG